MKHILKTLLLLLLMVGISPLYAQDSNAKPEEEQTTEAEKEPLFALHSVNLEVGTYTPSFDGFNNVLVPQFGITEDFGTNVAFGANLKVSLPYNLQFRVGANYWSDTFDGTTAAVSEVKNTLTRYGAGLFYAPEFAEFFLATKTVHPYAGLDFQIVSVKTEMEVAGGSISEDGDDILFTPVLGADYLLFDFINVGLELRYNLGSYEQEITPATPVEVEMDGFEWRLHLGYRF